MIDGRGFDLLREGSGGKQKQGKAVGPTRHGNSEPLTPGIANQPRNIRCKTTD